MRIDDDGVGGASSAPDTGCPLAERVASLEGHLTVRSSWRRHPGRGGDPVRIVIADDSALLREACAWC